MEFSKNIINIQRVTELLKIPSFSPIKRKFSAEFYAISEKYGNKFMKQCIKIQDKYI